MKCKARVGLTRKIWVGGREECIAKLASTGKIWVGDITDVTRARGRARAPVWCVCAGVCAGGRGRVRVLPARCGLAAWQVGGARSGELPGLAPNPQP